ncbi:hypothetical protein [Piscinibacter defluvii]|uniref:hypothetical protein n=1 Tax=Piscinibacter defluvii TaxID=1796922 RepID=UPI000FDF4783|nr:hypothetical protein [Piscinibacter defluvii]
MNLCEHILAASVVAPGLLALPAPALAQFTIQGAPVAYEFLPHLPNCAAHPEARATGCNMWSDTVQAPAPRFGADPFKAVACGVTNVHPTKVLRVAVDLYKSRTNVHDTWLFYGVPPGGAVFRYDRLGAEDSGHCRLTLIVTGPQDHADERQVRAAVTMVDESGSLLASSPVR